MMNDLFELSVFPIFVVAYYSLIAAGMAAPLALLVLVFDTTIGKRMMPRFRCLLWLLVVARLVMPIAPESLFSVHNLWDVVFSEEPSYAEQVEYVAPVINSATTENNQTISEFMSAPRAVAEPIPSVPATGMPWDEILVCSLLLLWFAGVLVLLFRPIIATVRFAKRLRSIPLVDDQHTINLLLRVCNELATGQIPQVKYVPDLPTPALFGLFRPTLCLPEETRSSMNDSQLRMIMLHEVMHLRRRDGYLSWLMTVVQAVHWFNPIAWFVMGRVAMYREQACDAAVRKFTEPEERHAYADLLLQFASQRPAASLGLVGLWFARPVRGLTARIKTFTSAEENQHRFPRLTFGAVFGLLAIVGLTDAASTDVESESLSPPVFTLSNETAWEVLDTHAHGDEADAENELVEERVYDIAQALKNLAEANPDEDAYQILLIYLRLPGMKPLSVNRDDQSENQLTVKMSKKAHDNFANFLDGLSRSGPWQVCVEMREFHINSLDAITGIDWQDAVKFAMPVPANSSNWSTDSKIEGSPKFSFSVESVSYEYAPYLAFVPDQQQVHQIVGQSNEIFQSLKVTVFNGQKMSLGSESLSPFVMGLQYIKGELATAAQPDIAVLRDGATMEVRPLVVDKNAVDLQCRLTVSHIDGVRELKLPGQELTIQVPRASRKTISARCQLKPGQTLLIAPTTGKREGEETEPHYYAITPQWFPDHIALDYESPTP